MIYFRHGGDPLIARMSRNISSFFVSKGIISEDDKDVYIYSFEILLSTVVNFFALVLISIITHTIPETALYILGFVPLRQIAGGYHAKNHFRCFWILMFSYSIFLTLVYFLPMDFVFITIFVSGILSVVLVFVFAPSEDINKPFSNEETIRFKRKSRFIIMAYIVLISLLAVFITNKIFAFSLASGVLTVSISLLANFIKYENSRSKNSAVGGKGVNL